MRVALISTTDGEGGAARAATRLQCALRTLDVDATLLVQRKTSADPAVIEAPASAAASDTFWPLLQRELIGMNRAGPWNTHFSLGLPGADLAPHPAVTAADLIHLHWVSGFLSPVGIARLVALGKPVVWTFHDERAFTGGCHYAFDCCGFEKDCRDCPQLRDDPDHLSAALLADAQSLWPPGAITVVTPSRWLAGEARRSALFRASRIEVIPNALDTDQFRPRPKAEARAALGLPADTLAILFGADFGGERRKGFQELVAALHRCLQDDAFRRRCEKRRAVLLCFGNPGKELTSLPLPMQPLGYVRDDVALANIYAASDLFALPSLADNLPCTMVEALSCGTPVVAFAAGGIPEGVEDGVTGRLAPAGDVDQLARAILDLTADANARERMGHAARTAAEARYSPAAVGRQHMKLYEDLAAQRRQPLPSPGDAWCSAALTARLPALCRRAVARRSEVDPTNKRWRWLRRRVERLGDARGDFKAWLHEFERLTVVSNQPKRARYWDDFAGLFRRRDG